MVLADLHIPRSRYVIKHRPDHHAESVTAHHYTSKHLVAMDMFSRLSCLLSVITPDADLRLHHSYFAINASPRAAPDQPCPTYAKGCSGRTGCKVPTWPWGSASSRTQAWSRPGRSFLQSVEVRPRTGRRNTGGWICRRGCWRCIRRIASWGSS